MFNLIAGIVTVLAAVFAVFVYLESRRKEAVETQKAREYQHRIADLLSATNAVAQQGSLIANLTDRDEVTKKELKHLIIAQLHTVRSVQRILARTEAVEQQWKFGVPASYQRLESTAAADAKEPVPAADG